MSNNVDQLPCLFPAIKPSCGQSWRLRATAPSIRSPICRDQLCARLASSESDLAERLARGRQTVFWNRVAWAVQYLKSAVVIEPVRRAVYRITDRGRSLLKGGEVNAKALGQFPEFTDCLGKSAEPGASPDPIDLPPEDTSETPEVIASICNYRIHREALAAELLESIRNGSPAAFERLVVDLLVAMGYGGPFENAGEVVGRSGDGGIDGIIKQDKLGLDAIYVRAKRWTNSVGSPEIMQLRRSYQATRHSRSCDHTVEILQRRERICPVTSAEHRLDRWRATFVADDRPQCRRRN